MNTLKASILALAIGFVALFPSVGHAQIILKTTTTNGAVTSLSTDRIVLTSTADITATYCGGQLSNCGLFVDWEYMTVVSIPVSGTVQVTRGANRTPASLHATGKTVIIGPNNAFTGSDVDGTIGRAPGVPCTLTNQLYTPTVNVTNGNIWTCLASVWKATNIAPITYNSLNLN